LADTLDAIPSDVAQIRCAAMLPEAFIWPAFSFGGYCYVIQCGADKAVITMKP